MILMAGKKLDVDRIKNYYSRVNSSNDEDYLAESFHDADLQDQLMYLLSAQWNELGKETDLPKKNLQKTLDKIHHNINLRRSVREQGRVFQMQKWFLRIAAIFLLPLAIYFGNQQFKASRWHKNSWAEIAAPAWTRTQFTLPDGTEGWLNSNSKIKYNLYNPRKVELIGEAFFDVKKNRNKTFSVTSNNVKILVLGTRFNVAAYENEKITEVVLAEGKVLFEDKTSGKKYEMSPEQLLAYNTENNTFRVYKVEPDKYLSWTEGKLVFRNDPIEAIARKLARSYNVEVEVVDKAYISDLRLRATFIDEKLEDVLKLLKLSLPVEYEIIDRKKDINGTYNKEKVIIFPRKR